MSEENRQDREAERLAEIEKYRVRQRRTMIGMGGGLGVGLMLTALVPWVRQNLDPVTVILWSMVLGIVLVNFSRFAEAGAIITRDEENSVLNYVVGLGLPVLFLLLIAFFTR